ncbi:MAG: HNH endonuclease [Halothiobacillus sp.]|nr:HNH endonuclease [Halothiobacillus sp.]
MLPQCASLQVEHIVPRSRGGSNRISNLTLSCAACNTAKGTWSVEEFLVHDPQRLARIKAQAKAPLRDAAAVNSTRWALFNALKATGLPVETGTGGKTKFNRTRFFIPKGHALDASCVGDVADVQGWQQPVLQIKATGRGSYQRTRLDRYGFPRGHLMRSKHVHGFQTGDSVKAVVSSGKKTGTYQGRVAIRASGSFNIRTPQGVIQGIHHRHCTLIQRADGYGYSWNQDSLSGKEAGTGAACAAALSLLGLNAGVSRAN